VLYEAIIIAVGCGLLMRGRLRNLAEMRMKQIWLVFLSFGIQLGMEFLWGRGFRGISGYVPVFQATSYLLLFAFLWVNRRQPGILLLSVGFVLNFVVIVANSGTMPTTIHGIEQQYINMLQSHGSATYSIISEDTRLPWLADIMVQPWPKAKAFSVGDIFISLGIFWLVFRIMTQDPGVCKIVSVREMRRD